MRNSNYRWSVPEHIGTCWEQCPFRSSTANNVDTPERKNVFHLDYYLPPTILIDGMAVVHELNVHQSHIVIVKTIQHSLLAQLTTGLSANATHTYALMTTVQLAEISYETTKNSWQIF